MVALVALELEEKLSQPFSLIHLLMELMTTTKVKCHLPITQKLAPRQ